jgi:shikimate dehydrogenase
VKSKNIILIGNGATSRTIKLVLENRNAKEIVSLVREVRNENEYLLSEYSRFSNYEIIINTTPYGTFPCENENPLFPLSSFSQLTSCIDVVYNPRFTPLLLAAKQKNIVAINGLMMLVAQAAKGLELVNKENYSSKIVYIHSFLKEKLTNIVLIGMPFSGKTTLGKQLSNKLERLFYDVDEELLKLNWDLATLIKTESLASFREKEAEMTKKLAQNRGIVLATGGGVVLNEEVMHQLQQNSVIIFINTPLSVLCKRLNNSRPLVKTSNDLENLFINRIANYHKFADLVITENNSDTIMEKINEYFNYKWS